MGFSLWHLRTVKRGKTVLSVPLPHSFAISLRRVNPNTLPRTKRVLSMRVSFRFNSELGKKNAGDCAGPEMPKISFVFLLIEKNNFTDSQESGFRSQNLEWPANRDPTACSPNWWAFCHNTKSSHLVAGLQSPVSRILTSDFWILIPDSRLLES
jgi:hypothetical protein